MNKFANRFLLTFSAISIQPAQHFGVVFSGILPSKVAKRKECHRAEASSTRFHRIEQDVTWMQEKPEAKKVKPKSKKNQKTHPSENRARVGHPQVSLRRTSQTSLCSSGNHPYCDLLGPSGWGRLALSP
jgi:hypothetical protein